MLTILTAVAVLVAGCGLFSGPESAAEGSPPTEERQLVPTFTPTATDIPPTPTVGSAANVMSTADPTEEPAQDTVTTATATLETVEATPTPIIQQTPKSEPVTEPVLTVAGDLINIRRGPSTAYDIVGSALKGERFDVTGKNQAGEWWQICCVGEQSGWIFAQLATVQNEELVQVATDIPPPPTAAPVAVEEPASSEPAANPQPGAPPDPGASSEGWFDPSAQYHITNLRVLGLGENNGGIRSPQSLHYILVTVLDENGNGVDGAVVRNLVGEKLDYVTGNKGPGKTEITMFWEPFKLTVASDRSGPVSSQVSNQMGLAFPHLPDIVGKLGDENYEYGVCPTLEIKCEWPIQAVHFSYEITFQKVR